VSYVYVVAAGERGEGHDPVSAWTTLAGARRFILARYDISVGLVSPGYWQGSISSADQVSIHRLPLEEQQ